MNGNHRESYSQYNAYEWLTFSTFQKSLNEFSVQEKFIGTLWQFSFTNQTNVLVFFFLCLLSELILNGNCAFGSFCFSKLELKSVVFFSLYSRLQFVLEMECISVFYSRCVAWVSKIFWLIMEISDHQNAKKI